MAETTDFDKLRRARRRKKRFRQLVIALIALALTAVGLFTMIVVYQLDVATQAQNFIASATTSGEGFPIATRDIQVRDIQTMGNDVVVVADAGVYVYNTKGGLLISRQNQYSQPLVRIAGGKILTYDLGGSNWRVDNKAKELYTGSCPGRLYAADLAQSGHVATAASAEGYLTRVTIYSPTFEEQYNWYTNECYITDLGISRFGDTFCAAGISAVDGRLVGQLRFHRTDQGAEIAKVELPGELIISIRWTDENRLQVVTDQCAYVFSRDGQQLYQADMPGEITHVENLSEGGIYIAHGDHRSADGATVEAYDKVLEIKGSCTVDKRILALEQSGSRLVILTEGQVLLANGTLTQVQERRDTNMYYVCVTGNIIYGITPEGLVRENL